LSPEAQAKVIALFHFALRQGGVLLLGSAERVGNNIEDRFEVISKPERLYRRVGHNQRGEAFSMGGVRVPIRSLQGKEASSQAAFADLCHQLVLENYAPASVLINRKHQSVYSLGPIDLYLSVPSGPPTHDVLAMASQGLRNKLRSAIQEAGQKNERVVVAGGRRNHGDSVILFSIDVRPVHRDGEEFFLVCFVDNPAREQKEKLPTKPQDVSRVAELEKELEATRTELQDAIHNLEISNKEHIAINEEAMSINEEFQSTNEELLTSKEELQSLNEELTALNTQLQETLERQRTTADDLQNILNSTDVATIFLDIKFNIRFFTPASKSLFSILPGDIGRPLADLRSLAVDKTLLADAQKVLQTLVPNEREIEAQNGIWFVRRVMPYRTADNRIAGVVITFIDTTHRKNTADLLAAAKQDADTANAAKSRFLAAASHDLRQPLQIIALLQGLLVTTVKSANAQKLLVRLDETLSVMSSMLNALLDINQIESGTVRPEIINFPVNDLILGMREEFSYHAQAQGLELHVHPCGLSINSDPRLLEQMIRNLLANALKYTHQGKVLLGCRRSEGKLSIEIWDTGIGIPDEKLRSIFEEYNQLDNAARERSRGLGLGLSIVRRLGDLLGHKVTVRSHVGKGSVFAIEVPLAKGETKPLHEIPVRDKENKIAGVPRKGTILIVEDDPDVRELLDVFLKSEGHRTAAMIDAVAALELVAQSKVRPDLILADYNLPNGMDGLQLAIKVREIFHHAIPTIVLTGDISTGVLRDIAFQNCTRLSKPVNVSELSQVIQRLLSIP
jgi:two-component system CheB/CheR fusion protein